MIEIWDTYTQVLGTVFPIAVGIYTFRLAAFLKGGILYRPFRLMTPGFLIYAMGSFVDLLALTEVLPETFHFWHFVAYLLFFLIITYSIYLLYRAWRSVGMGEV